MLIDRETLYMLCPLCGKEAPTCPYIIYNDWQFYSQEGRFPKSNRFNPLKHYRQWIKYIFGECPFIPANVLNQCKNNTTIQEIRHSLKTIGRSDLNKYTSAIWSRVTNQPIPFVSFEVLEEGEHLFLKILTARKQITTLKHKNKIYYPYYIFKILEYLIPKTEDKSILNLIYLQFTPTLKKNNQEWKLITQKLKLN